MRADPDATLALLAELVTATDEALRAHARRLAARLVLDRSRAGRAVRRGVRRPLAVPADRGGDLDVDASLEAVATARSERRAPDLAELTARDWGGPPLALCLLVDRSGSMTGARLATAAMVTAACALRAPGEFAVSAFARTVEPVRHLDEASAAETVVDRVLALRGHGVTGLAAALRHGADVLTAARAPRRVVVLLSDCRATDDEDPVPAAGGIAELIVLAPEGDTEAAAGFAAATGARWAAIAGADSAMSVLTELLGSP